MESSIYEISYKLRKELQKKICTGIIIVLSLISAISLFMTFVLFPVMQKSNSMNPTIQEPCVSFVSPLLKSPKRGDLIYLKPFSRPKLSMPARIINNFAGFFTARQYFPFTTNTKVSENGCIRRIVALPGDTIRLNENILHIKPKNSNVFLTEFELSEKNYTIKLETTKENWDGELGSIANIKEFVLKDDEYFVLGDNRNVCADSRTWGPLKSSNFSGKVLLTYLPFNKFKFYGL